MIKTFFQSVIIIFLIGSCSQEFSPVSTISEETWGVVDGKEVKHFTLTNRNGVELKITNYGGTINSISTPDKDGVIENVVIGYNTLQENIEDHSHGKTIGRFVNRIGGAQFTLNGTTYKLTANNGPNSIHGGIKGFAHQVFDIDSTYANADSAVVSLHYTSADMEEGFPGELTLFLNFILNTDNEVKLDYKAVTNKPTVVNFTNHVYFNLTGSGDTILDNQLKILADSITEMAVDNLPTGKIIPVAETTFDFTKSAKIGEKKEPNSRGYDINYKLRKKGNEMTKAAEVIDSKSGRILEAYTTEPGMQLFTKANSICLEMQHFPDSPNHPNFPSVVLNPGETYKQTTIYKFSKQTQNENK